MNTLRLARESDEPLVRGCHWRVEAPLQKIENIQHDNLIPFSGPGGRRFKSSLPDQFFSNTCRIGRGRGFTQKGLHCSGWLLARRNLPPHAGGGQTHSFHSFFPPRPVTNKIADRGHPGWSSSPAAVSLVLDIQSADEHSRPAPASPSARCATTTWFFAPMAPLRNGPSPPRVGAPD
jgi:hypothetical protein